MATRLEGQYSGAALTSVIRALERSQVLIKDILRVHGLERIDPDAWYDLETAASIYRSIGERIGSAGLFAVGQRIIDAAPFPPGITDVRGVLASLDAAYRMSVRGPNIGGITCEFSGPEERSALLVFTTPAPCAMNRGIVHGCCRRFGATPLIEHAGDGCVDEGGDTDIYRVSW